MRKVKVIPVITAALGTVTKHFEKWIEKLDLDLTIEATQKHCLLGTARIIRSVGYEMKIIIMMMMMIIIIIIIIITIIIMPQYLRQLLGLRYCGIFYQEITSDMRVKEIIIIVIISPRPGNTGLMSSGG